MKAKKAIKGIFFLRLIIFFIIIYLLWHFTAPIGAKALSFFSGNIIMLIDQANRTKAVEAVRDLIVVVYEPAIDGKTLNLEYKGFTFNMVFLFALIMAVPNVNYKLRLKILIIGFIIVYPIQVFRVVIYVFNYYCHNIKRRSGATIYPTYLHNTIGYLDKTLIRIDGQIIPVVIWAALFYYYKWHNIFKKLRQAKAEESEDSK